MNLCTIKGVRMEAISAVVPKNIVNNREFAKEHFEEDMTATINALGIEQRHVCANPETTALDMCCKAADRIFEDGKIAREDIGAVVFVTQTPDMLIPNNASIAQFRLGLQRDTLAFDINHACAGWIYGLWNASLVAKNLNKKVLLLDGDTNSKYVSPWDKGTALLFGDCGTATIITPADNVPDWHFTFDTDGSKAAATTLDIGFKRQLSEKSFEYEVQNDGGKRRQIDMYMDGAGIFAHGYQFIPKLINEFMDELETDESEYDKLIAHQANLLLLRKVGKKVGFPEEKQVYIIENYGNSSSTCIPLAVCIKKEQCHALIYGIGAGVSISVGDVRFDGSIYEVSEEMF